MGSIGISGARVQGGITGSGGRNVAPVNRQLSESAQRSIAEARKAMGSTKPSEAEMAKRARANKANELEKIRKQGRNTR
jgi:hypothetical protein